AERGDDRRLVRLGRPRQLGRLGAAPAAGRARERHVGRRGAGGLRPLRRGGGRLSCRSTGSFGYGGGGHASGHARVPEAGHVTRAPRHRGGAGAREPRMSIRRELTLAAVVLAVATGCAPMATTPGKPASPAAPPASPVAAAVTPADSLASLKPTGTAID